MERGKIPSLALLSIAIQSQVDVDERFEQVVQAKPLFAATQDAGSAAAVPYSSSRWQHCRHLADRHSGKPASTPEGQP